MKKKVILKFANCIPVRGAVRSMICDLQRKNLYPVPHALVSIIENYAGKSREEIYLQFPEEDHPVLDEYFRFLFEQEIVFLTDEAEATRFPGISPEWDFPAHVVSLVVEDFDRLSSPLLMQADRLGVHTMAIIFKNDPGEGMLGDVLLKLGNTMVDNVVAVVETENTLSGKNLEKLINDGRVSEVRIYEAKGTYSSGKVFYAQEKFSFMRHPVAINDPSVALYTESLHYNTYFNRKVFIGEQGEIKNTWENKPEHIFGNIYRDEIADVLKDKNFGIYWTVNKDRISVCRDCEFRRVCVDSRIPHRRSEGNWYYETECDYNPYLAKWKGEEGYKNLPGTNIVYEEECRIEKNKE